MTFKKIRFTLVGLVLMATLTACGSGEKKKEIVDTKYDKFTKVMILTDSEKLQPNEYSSAEALVKNNEYQKKHDKDEKLDISHSILPDDMDSQAMNKIFDKIKNDKDINTLVVSSENSGIIHYIKSLDRARKDIITISAFSSKDVKDLAENFDIALDYEKKTDAKEIVDIAKTLGAERFISIVDEESLGHDHKQELLAELRDKSSKIDTPYEEIKIPSGMDRISKKAYVSNEISKYISKYGNDINFYPTSRDIDEVLLNRLVSDKFIIAELSQRNSTKFMMDIYGLKQIGRMSENYNLLNGQISSFFNTNYGFGGRVAGLGADPRSHIIRYATQLGVTLNSKSAKPDKAYNTYFLEQVSTIRTQISAGFKTPYKQYKNYKVMSVDQIVY